MIVHLSCQGAVEIPAMLTMDHAAFEMRSPPPGAPPTQQPSKPLLQRRVLHIVSVLGTANGRVSIEQKLPETPIWVLVP